jgi:asparagine synthase (glutamine-hydrolysing)
MKDRLPDVILNRPKQAYRAPIRSSFISDNLPAYLKDMLSEKAIVQAGIFNPDHVNQLLNKMKGGNQVSEIDNMAITAILSTQILNDLLINISIQ